MCSRDLLCVFTVWLISEKPSMDLLRIKKVLTTGGEPTKAGFPIQDQAWWAIRLQIQSHYHFELERYHIVRALSLATFQRSAIPSICWWHSFIFLNGLQLFALVNPIRALQTASKTDFSILTLPILANIQTNRTLITSHAINCCKSNRGERKLVHQAMGF